MDVCVEQQKPVVHHPAAAAILLVTLLIGSYLVVAREIRTIETGLSHQVAARASSLREYFLVARHLLFSLQRSMQENLGLAEAGALLNPAVDQLRDYPDYGVYGIESQLPTNHLSDPRHELAPLAGTLSGLGSVAAIGEDLERELHGALALNAMLDSTLHSLPDLKWVYYASAAGFIYLSPGVPIEAFRFSEDFYRLPFWRLATPEANPSGGLVVTNVYQDAAGKGPMISLSLPVSHLQRFRGVVSMDIGVDSLVRRLTEENLLGYSALINQQRQVIIKEMGMDDTTLAPDNGDLVFLQPLLDPQLVLLHKVPYGMIVREALGRSVTRLAVILFALILIYMVYHQRLLVRKIERLADTDPLTRLMNRRAMERVVQTMISYTTRYDQHIGFMLLDIDHFKRINDTHGHGVGDRVLVELAAVLRQTMRESDQVSRHGGEEFLVVMPNSDLQECRQLAERLRATVEAKPFGEQSLGMTISIGCAELGENEDYSAVLKRADDALYQAKAAGRNRVEQSAGPENP